MAVQTNTFKGARYVPKFADPIEWSADTSYEAIESVQHEGFTYLSKQPVPAGVQIDNEEFWLLWADPNAQMEQLRQEVVTYAGNVEELSDEVEAIKTNIENAHVFDTVADMKTSTDLFAGAICHTNGFHTSGDGGAAWYVISATGTANEMDVIACGDLFANLIKENIMNVKQYGAFGDNAHDDTVSIQKCIDDNNNIIFKFGEYKISNPISISSNKNIDGNFSSINASENWSTTTQKSMIHNSHLVMNKDGQNDKNITIRNIVINDNNIPNTGELGVIGFRGALNVILDNIEINNECGASWGIILFSFNQNHDIKNCHIKSTMKNQTGGCIWVRGGYPTLALSDEYSTFDINVHECVFESSGTDECVVIADGLAGNHVEANVYNCTIIGNATDNYPNYLVTTYTRDNTSEVKSIFNNLVIKGNVNSYGVLLGNQGVDKEKLITSISDSTIKTNKGCILSYESLMPNVINCTLKGISNVAIYCVVTNCEIYGTAFVCHVFDSYIESENVGCEQCDRVFNSIIKAKKDGVLIRGNRTDVKIIGNTIYSDQNGVNYVSEDNSSLIGFVINDNTLRRLTNNAITSFGLNVFYATTGFLYNNVIYFNANGVNGGYSNTQTYSTTAKVDNVLVNV